MATILIVDDNAQVRALLRGIAAQEAERRRLAGDIHDGITQRLVSLAFHLDAAADADARDTGTAARELARARELTDLAMDEAANLLLRPVGRNCPLDRRK